MHDSVRLFHKLINESNNVDIAKTGIYNDIIELADILSGDIMLGTRDYGEFLHIIPYFQNFMLRGKYTFNFNVRSGGRPLMFQIWFDMWPSDIVLEGPMFMEIPAALYSLLYRRKKLPLKKLLLHATRMKLKSNVFIHEFARHIFRFGKKHLVMNFIITYVNVVENFYSSDHRNILDMPLEPESVAYYITLNDDVTLVETIMKKLDAYVKKRNLLTADYIDRIKRHLYE